MTTTTRTERDAQIIEQYRADLMRGTTFYRAAASADSADRMNYAGSLRARP